ncbi:MAG: hypothetical protein ABEJ81_05375 [Haloferacaceae archaeon]
MLSGKLPTGTVDGGGETDRGRRPAHDAAARGTDRRERIGDAGAVGRDPNAGASTTGDGTGGATAGTTGEPRATPHRSEDRRIQRDQRIRQTRSADRRVADETSRLRRRLSSERAERQAVIDHYERLLSERTGAATCDGAAAADGSARAWLRRAVSRVRSAWSRRG